MNGVYGYRITTDKPELVLNALGSVFESLGVLPGDEDPELLFNPEKWVELGCPEPGDPYPQRAKVLEDGSVETPGGVVVHVDGEKDGSKIWVEVQFNRPSIHAARMLLCALRSCIPECSVVLMDADHLAVSDDDGVVEGNPATILEEVKRLLWLTAREALDMYELWAYR